MPRSSPVDSGGSPSGGKGREIYLGPRCTQVSSGLRFVPTELDGDDKPWTWVAYECEGTRCLAVSFHNENEGNSVQKQQLREVVTRALELADENQVPYANVFVTGDTNLPSAEDDVEEWNWISARQARHEEGQLQVQDRHRNGGPSARASRSTSTCSASTPRSTSTSSSSTTSCRTTTCTTSTSGASAADVRQLSRRRAQVRADASVRLATWSITTRRLAASSAACAKSSANSASSSWPSDLSSTSTSASNSSR